MDPSKFNGLRKVSISSQLTTNILFDSSVNPNDCDKKKRNSSFSFRDVHKLLSPPVIDKSVAKISIPYLMLVSIDKVTAKDFSTEVRAVLDIQKFLKEATIILDMEEFQPMKIVEKILYKVISDNEVDIGHNHVKEMILEAREALFTQIEISNYSYQRLTRTIKGILLNPIDGTTVNQPWICAMCSFSSINKRFLSITRLKYPVNFGRNGIRVNFVILVLTPKKEKESKSDFELSRTFATLFSSIEYRSELLTTDSPDIFRQYLKLEAERLAEHHKKMYLKMDGKNNKNKHPNISGFRYNINGLIEEIISIIPDCKSDFIGGFQNFYSFKNMCYGILILYFVTVFTGAAFGKLYDKKSDGNISMENFLTAQAIAGVTYSILGSHSFVLLVSNVYILLLIEVFVEISKNLQFDFFALYGWTGIFISGFLFCYSIFNMSNLISWQSRFFAETSALFISVGFMVVSASDIYAAFQYFYKIKFKRSSVSILNGSWILTNQTSDSVLIDILLEESNKDAFLLFVLLIIGTVWVAVYFGNFTTTTFLNHSKRKLMADYCLPISVISMSFLGSFIFKDIKACLLVEMKLRNISDRFHSITNVSFQTLAMSFALAIPISFVFFFDQNITSAAVNRVSHKFRKRTTPNYDLLVICLINCILSLCGLPWIHGSLVHSRIYLKILSESETKLDMKPNGISSLQQTRLSSFFAHILVGTSIWLLPKVFNYVPVSVLDGIFIYSALMGLKDNQLFERIMLFLTEQAAYPPSHYLKRVPQRIVHIFTLIQVVQILFMCISGYTFPIYIRISFPLFLLLQIPIRWKILPKIIQKSYLDALD